MKKIRNIPSVLSVKKLVSIVVMCLCLAFLTGVNFFIYPPSQPALAIFTHSGDTNDEESPTPVEEKSSSKTGISTAQEEYIHDLHHIRNLSAIEILSRYKIPETEKLQIVHFERVSPPPKA